jgi:hypothetical protein
MFRVKGEPGYKDERLFFDSQLSVHDWLVRVILGCGEAALRGRNTRLHTRHGQDAGEEEQWAGLPTSPPQAHVQ